MMVATIANYCCRQMFAAATIIAATLLCRHFVLRSIGVLFCLLSVLILFSVNLSLVYIFFQPLKIRNFLPQPISSGKNVQVKEVLGPTPSTVVLHGLDDQDDGRPDGFL